MFAVNLLGRRFPPRVAVSGWLGCTGEDAAAQDDG